MAKGKEKKKLSAKDYWEDSKNKTIEIAELEGRKLKSWQVVYETIDRWSSKNHAEAEKKIMLFVANDPKIKKEIANAARAVQEGTHEQINASSQAQFLINVAIGKQVSNSGRVFERTAEAKDGTNIPITNLAEKNRIPTVEFMTKPLKAKEIKNALKRLEDSDEEDLHVLTGHVGAMSINEEGVPVPPSKLSSYSVVSKAGSSSGKDGVHVAQLNAQKESSHHRSLSTRLSKVMDNFQEDGTTVLKAFNKSGFHLDSNWQGFYIKNAQDALIVALKARHNYKKRQTQEKTIRDDYAEPASISDDYTEIRTESETDTETYGEFVKKTVKEGVFKEFIEKHKINVKSHSFRIRSEELDKALSIKIRE